MFGLLNQGLGTAADQWEERETWEELSDPWGIGGGGGEDFIIENAAAG